VTCRGLGDGCRYRLDDGAGGGVVSGLFLT
jgi:hypothetical protein